MTRALWLRFFAISVVFAILLGVAYAWLVRAMTGESNQAVQSDICLFLARIVESSDYGTSLKRIDAYRSESRLLPMQLWVVTSSGAILARNTAAAIPPTWRTAHLPQRVHDVVLHARSLPAFPEFAVVRLAAPAPTYLLVKNIWVESRRLLALQSVVFVGTLVLAIFLGLSLVTLYLRGRSREARQVIADMKSGRLDARLTVTRLDALGNLMIDFNAMADEIERLIDRLRVTERARSELLQELGHDLRTPLTSLTTSTEALLTHRSSMSTEEQAEFVGVIKGELDYLKRLVEDLFFIAEMAEPQYRQRAESVDLQAAVAAEMQVVEGLNQSNGRHIALSSNFAPVGRSVVRGDAHLIGRVLRNAIDNAVRFARQAVEVRISESPGYIVVAVEDDGPGMTAEQIASFGRRRAQRIVADSASASVSLGLGSVIVNSVLALHGGHFTIESIQVGHAVRGTRLSLFFPASAGPSSAE